MHDAENIILVIGAAGQFFKNKRKVLLRYNTHQPMIPLRLSLCNSTKPLKASITFLTS